MKIFNKLLVGLIGAFSIANASAADIVNLLTSETGMQRITYEQLRDQGADLAGIQHRSFSLTLNDDNKTPVEIHIKGQDKSAGSKNKFGPGAYIEFYAEANDSIYTNQVAHTLMVGGDRKKRKRMGQDKTKYDKTSPATTLYKHTEIVEENAVYDSLAPSFKDPWHFGFSVSQFGPFPTYTFNLDNVANGATTADVQVEMYGLLDYAFEGNDHHYEALINGVVIGSEQFDGVAIAGIEASGVAINEGANTFRYNYLPLAVAAFDRVTVNKITLEYSRNTVAIDGVLTGWIDGDQVSVSNLGSQLAKVYRKNSDGSIVRITRTKRVGGNTSFGTGGVAADYMVVSELNGYKTPEVAALANEQDISSGQAEYLVIAHDSLMGASLDQLVQMRQQNYAVKVVDVRQIYSQYGEGVLSADAIQAYINHAVANMSTQFVVFIGSDTYDYNNYKSNAVSLIPTKYVTTPGGEVTVYHAPSDAAYGDVDFDGVPDVTVGRISARTTDELSDVVEKIAAYQARDGYAGRVLVAADRLDNGSGISFTDDAIALINAMPSDWRGSVRNDYRAFPDIDGSALAHDKIIAGINAGVSVVSYIGHSAPDRWSSSPTLLHSSEISQFTNIDKPHVAIQWGCWNTYFVDPSGNNMADQFLLAGKMGAVAVLGASTLTTSIEERAYGLLLNGYLYDEGMTIGEAVLRAKQDLSQGPDSSSAIQYGYNIIGDPAIVINH